MFTADGCVSTEDSGEDFDCKALMARGPRLAAGSWRSLRSKKGTDAELKKSSASVHLKEIFSIDSSFCLRLIQNDDAILSSDAKPFVKLAFQNKRHQGSVPRLIH
jgi:hypothetical protein